MKCPHCNGKIFQKSEDSIKLRTQILIFEDELCKAKCRYCKELIELPIALTEEITVPDRIILRKPVKI